MVRPHFFDKKFGEYKKLRTFVFPFGNNAEIAQLVERNLAKVEVAGPSPVFRSKTIIQPSETLWWLICFMRITLSPATIWQVCVLPTEQNPKQAANKEKHTKNVIICDRNVLNHILVTKRA